MGRIIAAIAAIATVALPVAAAAQAGSFAGGFAQGLAQGAAIRERHAAAAARAEQAKTLKLCNAALENYLNGKGPAPPAMCNNGASPALNVADAPAPMPAVSPPPAPSAPAGPTFANCMPDSVGGMHCVSH